MAIHLSDQPENMERAARSLLDLAPGGVYPAAVSPRTLVRSYRTGHPDWPLASTLPYGAPTFLDEQALAATIQPAHRRSYCCLFSSCPSRGVFDIDRKAVEIHLCRMQQCSTRVAKCVLGWEVVR